MSFSICWHVVIKHVVVTDIRKKIADHWLSTSNNLLDKKAELVENLGSISARYVFQNKRIFPLLLFLGYKIIPTTSV